MTENKNHKQALFTLVSVFFFWGFIAASNGVFIPFCKSYFQIDQFQSQLVDFAFYGAYYFDYFHQCCGYWASCFGVWCNSVAEIYSFLFEYYPYFYADTIGIFTIVVLVLCWNKRESRAFGYGQFLYWEVS